MCSILDIDKTRTTPLRPQSDGMVEKFNRTLEAMLSMFEDSNQDWDCNLPLLMIAYQSLVHESIDFTTNEMMLGREVMLPVDLLFRKPEPEIDEVDMEEIPRSYDWKKSTSLHVSTSRSPVIGRRRIMIADQ